MKSFREFFEENYQAYEQPCNNKRGFKISYQYVGLWYQYDLSEEERGRYKRIFFGMCLLSTVFFATAALWNSVYNYGNLPALFSGLSLAAFLFEWYAVLKFVAAKERETKPDFEQMNELLRIVPVLNAFLLAGAGISCIVLMARNGAVLSDGILPLCYLLAGICSFTITFFYRALPYQKQENDLIHKKV